MTVTVRPQLPWLLSRFQVPVFFAVEEQRTLDVDVTAHALRREIAATIINGNADIE